MRTYTVIEYEKEDYQNFKDNLTDEKAIDILERFQEDGCLIIIFREKKAILRIIVYIRLYIVLKMR